MFARLRNLIRSKKHETRRKDGSPTIIFVHGLGGSAEGTWGAMLQCLVNSEDLKHCAYDCYAYPTGLVRPLFGSRKPGINELSDGLATHISVHHRDASQIVLVGHSLGGLVIRRYLVSISESDAARKIASVLIYGTPSHGSVFAHVSDAFSLNHEQAKQLLPNSDALDALNRDWAARKIEEKFQITFVVGGVDAIVHRSSSILSHNTKVHTIINQGHRELVKPTSVDDTAFQLLIQHVQENCAVAQLANEAAQVAAVEPKRKKPCDPLFDIYTKDVDEYYLKRLPDTEIANATISSHLWVSGPSGCGKTAALRRLSAMSGWRLQHLLMNGSPRRSATSLISAICNELYDRAGKAEITVGPEAQLHELVLHFGRAVAILAETEDIAILIEEFSFADQTMIGDLLHIVYHLMQSLQTKRHKRVILLFSSINDVNGKLDPSLKHFRERMQFVRFSEWIDKDVVKLIRIAKKATAVKIGTPQVRVLVSEAKGSPRFVKHVLRKMRNNIEVTFERAVDEAKGERV